MNKKHLEIYLKNTGNIMEFCQSRKVGTLNTDSTATVTRQVAKGTHLCLSGNVQILLLCSVLEIMNWVFALMKIFDGLGQYNADYVLIMYQISCIQSESPDHMHISPHIY